MIPILSSQERSVTFVHDSDESWLKLVFSYHGIWPQMWIPLLVWTLCWVRIKTFTFTGKNYFCECVVEYHEEEKVDGKNLKDWFVTFDKNKDKIRNIPKIFLSSPAKKYIVRNSHRLYSWILREFDLPTMVDSLPNYSFSRKRVYDPSYSDARK